MGLFSKRGAPSSILSKTDEQIRQRIADLPRSSEEIVTMDSNLSSQRARTVPSIRTGPVIPAPSVPTASPTPVHQPMITVDYRDVMQASPMNSSLLQTMPKRTSSLVFRLSAATPNSKYQSTSPTASSRGPQLQGQRKPSKAPDTQPKTPQDSSPAFSTQRKSISKGFALTRHKIRGAVKDVWPEIPRNPEGRLEHDNKDIEAIQEIDELGEDMMNHRILRSKRLTKSLDEAIVERLDKPRARTRPKAAPSPLSDTDDSSGDSLRAYFDASEYSPNDLRAGTKDVVEPPALFRLPSEKRRTSEPARSHRRSSMADESSARSDRRPSVVSMFDVTHATNVRRIRSSKMAPLAAIDSLIPDVFIDPTTPESELKLTRLEAASTTAHRTRSVNGDFSKLPLVELVKYYFRSPAKHMENPTIVRETRKEQVLSRQRKSPTNDTLSLESQWQLYLQNDMFSKSPESRARMRGPSKYVRLSTTHTNHFPAWTRNLRPDGYQWTQEQVVDIVDADREPFST